MATVSARAVSPVTWCVKQVTVCWKCSDILVLHCDWKHLAHEAGVTDDGGAVHLRGWLRQSLSDASQ